MATTNITPIPEFPGYGIDKSGQVWSRKNGRYGLKDQWRLLAGSVQSRGYRIVSLRRSKKTHHRYVHRLVLEVFVGPCPEGMETRHLDGDKLNNRLSNLEWGTPDENYHDRVSHGTVARGEKIHQAKLTEEAARAIKHSSRPTSLLARYHGVSQATICDIRKGRTWSHIS